MSVAFTKEDSAETASEAVLPDRPVSSALITYANDAGGLHGWQWMFIIEGVPTVLLGFFTLLYLPNTPAQAKWLTSSSIFRPDRRSVAAARAASSSTARPRRCIPVSMWMAQGREPCARAQAV